MKKKSETAETAGVGVLAIANGHFANEKLGRPIGRLEAAGS